MMADRKYFLQSLMLLCLPCFGSADSSKDALTYQEPLSQHFMPEAGSSFTNLQPFVEVSQSVPDPCDRYDVDGCSIPFGLPFFFKTLFTSSCNRHDICYHCGVQYEDSRLKCDVFFRHDTTVACLNAYDNLRAMATESFPVYSTLPRKDQRNYFRVFERRSLQKHRDLVVSMVKTLEDELVQSFQRRFHEHFLNDGNITSEDLKAFSNSKRDVVISDWVLELAQNPKTRYQWYLLRYYTPNSFMMKISQRKMCLDRRLSAIAYASRPSLDCTDILLCNCLFFSNVYYAAVAIFGGSSYHDTPEWYCNQNFVAGCLPQD